MKHPVFILMVFVCLFSSCQYPELLSVDKNIEDILPLNTNFELVADTFSISPEPLIELGINLHKEDKVAIAEFACYTIGTIDVNFIKVVHSDEKQGWITETELLENFVPVDSISQLINFLSSNYLQYIISIIALLCIVILIRLAKNKKIPFIFFNDIDTLYPILLCLLVSVSAVLYQSVQLFTPEDWLHYYFVPSLSPSGQPTLMSGFLLSLWLILIAVLAVVDVSFKKLSSGMAFAYLFGILCTCIFLYTFFIITTSFLIGYVFLCAFIIYFLYRVFKEMMYRYRCGNCGHKIKKRGECPRCGSMNV